MGVAEGTMRLVCYGLLNYLSQRNEAAKFLSLSDGNDDPSLTPYHTKT